GARAALVVRRRVCALRVGAPRERLSFGRLRAPALHQRDAHDRARGVAAAVGGPRATPGRREKIALYNPRAGLSTLPRALEAVGSELDADKYEVVIVAGRLDADPEKALLAELDGALCLGVTVLTGAPLADALGMSRAAKAARPDVPVVWGGWHPSMFGRQCLDEACVDVTVQAQGEATFAEIVER